MAQGPGVAVDAIGVAIAAAITSVIISKLSGKIADVVAGSGENDRDRMYEEFHRKIGKANFNIVPEGKEAPRKIMTVMDRPETMAYVHRAIQELEDAKKTTNCRVCQQKLDAAIVAVGREAKVIAVSDAKYQIIQELKSNGKIPKNTTWDKMSPEQKKFVNKVAERGLKS